MPEVYCEVRVDNRLCLIASEFPAARGKANAYTCPVGREPGRAFVVMMKRDVDQLNFDAPHTLTLEGGGKVSIPGLFVVRIDCIEPVDPTEPESPYLVELADCRRQLCELSDVGTVAYNVRHPAPAIDGTEPKKYYLESLNTLASGVLWTWATMVADLWSRLPSIVGSAPSLPYTPHGTPEGFRFVGVNSWDALNAVLDKLGVTVVYNPFTRAFSFVRDGALQSGLSTVEQQNQYYEFATGTEFAVSTWLPEVVRVYFNRIDEHYGTEASTPRNENWSMFSTYMHEVATGVGGAIAGTAVAVWDDMPAIGNFDGTISNTSELNTRAAEVAANWVSRRTGSVGYKRYSNIIPGFLPGANVSRVTWRNFGYSPIDGDESTGCCTEVDKWNPSLSNGRGAGTSLVAENLAPPNLSRATHPVYPPVMHVIQIGGSGAAGTPQTPNGENLLEGLVCGVNPEASKLTGACYVTQETCWVLVTNPVGSAPSLKKGDRYLARLCGSATYSSDGRPLYVMDTDVQSQQVFRFRLTETLSLGGSAAAVVRVWNDDDDVYESAAEIEVQDFSTPGRWQAYNLAEGVCVRLPDKAEHEILWVEHPSIFATATLTSGFTGSAASANFTDNWQGPGGTGTAAFVYDPDGRYATLESGDKVLCCWDEFESKYKICDGPRSDGVKVVRFRLTEDFNPGDVSASAIIRQWNGAAWEDGPAITVFDFSTPGKFHGLENAQGIAVKLDNAPTEEDEPFYDILWLAHLPIFVRGILTADMGLGSAAFEIFGQWQGQLDVPIGDQFAWDDGDLYPNLKTDDVVLCAWDEFERKYKIVDALQDNRTRWAYATADWVNGAANTSYVVCEEAAGIDGPSSGGGTFNVRLPRPSASRDPNVRQGAIIGYEIAKDGTRFCTTDYLDDCIGTIKTWAGSAATIPPGWQLCNGSNGTHNLREKFVLGAFGDAGGITNFDGQGNGTTVGSSGGRRHTLPFPIIYEPLLTEPRYLDIWSSPGQTIPTSEVSLTLEGEVEGTADGYTEAAKADVLVIDPENVQMLELTGPGVGTNWEAHFDHMHLREGVEVEEAVATDVYGFESEASAVDITKFDTTYNAEIGTSMKLRHLVLEPGQKYVWGGGGEAFEHPVTDADPDTPGVQEGHRHQIVDLDVQFDAGDITVDPNPHFHEVQIADIAHALSIAPDPHDHVFNLPIKNIPGQNIVNPYYALCYIQRVN